MRFPGSITLTEIMNNAGEFKGKAKASVINAASLDEPFSYNNQEQYKPVTKAIKTNGNRLVCRFPAHSFTQIMVPVTR